MGKDIREKSVGKKKLIWIAAVVVILLLALVINITFTNKPDSKAQSDNELDESVLVAEEQSEESSEVQILEESVILEESSQAEESFVVEETEPVMLPDMAEHYAENPEVVGWLWVDDTKLNYPVMYTPDDPEKYIHLDFNEEYDVGGLPFVDAKCSMDPRSDNLIIYGHNMMNGTQFGSLMDYAEESYWQEHPQFHFSTLYETKTYDIVAAFYDRVYYKHEDVFKFYQFIDAENEADFQNAIDNYQMKALYDTGVTAEYGDELITLVTCSYHTDNGRFVVIGRAVEEVEQ